MCEDRTVLATVEHDVLVHLVGQDGDIASADGLGERVKIRIGHYRTGRVVRTVDDDKPGALRYRSAHLLPVVAKIGQLQRQPQSSCTCEANGRIVGIVGRIEENDLVSRTDGCLNS